jgi:hypothetical protein
MLSVLGIDTGGGFVEGEDVGLPNQRECDQKTLKLATRHRSDRLVQHIFVKIHALQAWKQKRRCAMPASGKRYLCDECATEVLCNKAGAGTLECCGDPIKIKEAKPLPSSD